MKQHALDVEAVRRQFPALTAAPHLVHADAPGGTQVHEGVLAAMRDWLVQRNANSHGVFAASEETDAMVDAVRAQAAAFLGGHPGGIVFGANMTTLTWHLSHALTERIVAGDELVCTRLDHDANVAPWLALAARTGATVRWVQLRPDGTLDPASLDDAVTADTRLIAFPGASNALGTLVDPAPFVAAARTVGALTFCDAVHAAPHVPLDQRAAGIDVLACSPYKFCGPHAGILSAHPDLLADLTPDKVRPSPDEGPDRWQTGTAAFEDIAGTGAALDHLAEVGMAAVEEHGRALAARFLEGLAALPHVTLHGVPTAEGRTPTFALTLDGHTPEEAARALAADGIATWSGHYYAIEPLRALGLLHRGGALRVGFVHYHRDADVDRVLEALARLG